MPERAIETRGFGGPLFAAERPTRIVMDRQGQGVVQAGDFLLCFALKPDDRLVRPQTEMGGKGFQRRHRAAMPVGIGGLDDHHRIRVQRGEYRPQRRRLTGAADVIPG